MFEPGTFPWIASTLLGIIITWSLGLLIPAIIRYVIVRKPISKALSVIICIANWLLNVTFWSYMALPIDSHSDSHAVQFFVALFAYYFMSKGYIDKNNNKKPTGKLKAKDLTFKDFIKR